MTHDREWSRREAASSIDDVLDGAKSGETQLIKDPDGVFEIKFVSKPAGTRKAGEFLSKGGLISR